MANLDKNILITPNTSAATGTYPTIKFNGANNTPINLSVLDDGTISFSATAGQLFSITDGLTGTIFSVNDISGIPSIEVLDTGLVKLNQYGGSTVFGASSAIQNGSAVNAKVSLSTGSATTPGLIVKGVASQTANLIEWQNSSGVTLGFINAEGSIQSANRIISPGDFEARGNSFHGNAPFGGATVNITTRATTQVGAIIRGVASQTANLQEWQNSAAVSVAQISATGTISTKPVGFSGNLNTAIISVTDRASTWTAGNFAFRSDSGGTPRFSFTAPNAASEALSINGNFVGVQTPSPTAVFQVTSNAAGNVAAIVKGFASQTANLQEWQDSAGTVLGFFASNGTLKSNYVQTTLLRSPLSDKSQIYTDADGNGAIRLDVGGPTQKGFIIRGAASQTANLQEWQASDATVLARIDNNGSFITKNGLATGSLSFSGITYNGLSNPTGITSVPTLVVKAIGSQTANLQEWQNSSGTVLGSIGSGGAFDFQVGGHAITSYNTGQIMMRMFAPSGQTANIQNWYVDNAIVASIGAAGNTSVLLNSASEVGLTIKGAASQTANLTEWKDGSGNLVGYINNGAGAWFSNSIGVSATPYAYSAMVSINTANAGNKGLVIRGFASQTANLQEWQNSSGTALSKIASDGSLTVNGANINYRGDIFSPFNITATYALLAGKSSQSGTYNTFLTSWSQGAATLIVQGAASQTANLQEWQDSTGANLALMTSGGFLHGTGFRIKQNANSTISSAQGSIEIQGPTVRGLVIVAAASQTANLQEWQNSGGTVNAFVDASGRGRFLSAILGGISSSLGANFNLQPSAATITGAIIRGATSQTADLQQWQNSAGTVLAKVDASGNIYPNSIISTGGNANSFGGNTIAGVILAVNTTNATGVVIKAGGAQTANLQEWQDSSGNVLSKIDSFGAFKTASTASFGTINGGGVWGGYSPVVEIRNTDASTSAINIFANGGPAIRVYDGSGYQRGAWNQDGSIVVGQSNTKLATLSVYADSATSVGTIIRGAASQTANLQEWQNSSGTALSYIDKDGKATLTGGYISELYTGGGITGGTLGYLNASTFSASVSPIVVRGAASQTADLQQWQNSAGTVLAKVDTYGYVISNGAVLPSGAGSFETAYGGAFMGMKKTTATVANPGANVARMYFVAGTTAGTLKLVVKAGASGAETTILDNIPQS